MDIGGSCAPWCALCSLDVQLPTQQGEFQLSGVEAPAPATESRSASDTRGISQQAMVAAPGTGTRGAATRPEPQTHIHSTQTGKIDILADVAALTSAAAQQPAPAHAHNSRASSVAAVYSDDRRSHANSGPFQARSLAQPSGWVHVGTPALTPRTPLDSISAPSPMLQGYAWQHAVDPGVRPVSYGGYVMPHGPMVFGASPFPPYGVPATAPHPGYATYRYEGVTPVHEGDASQDGGSDGSVDEAQPSASAGPAKPRYAYRPAYRYALCIRMLIALPTTCLCWCGQVQPVR